jgi:hypothetical protein
MSVLDETLWTVNPLGAWQDQALSFLVSRPLALATAWLRLDLLGLPDYANDPAGLEQLVKEHVFATRGFTNVPAPVLLGDTTQLKDGLIGFFTGDDYSALFLAQNAVTPPPHQKYVRPNRPITLTADPSAAPVQVTMVVDPRAEVHATPGILPTESISLPPDQVGDALAAMHVTFITGPVVSDADRYAMPVPDVKGALWSWLEHDTPSGWTEIPKIAPVQMTAHLDPTPQEIHDGWLKLSGFTKPTGTQR